MFINLLIIEVPSNLNYQSILGISGKIPCPRPPCNNNSKNHKKLELECLSIYPLVLPKPHFLPGPYAQYNGLLEFLYPHANSLPQPHSMRTSRHPCEPALSFVPNFVAISLLQKLSYSIINLQSHFAWRRPY